MPGLLAKVRLLECEEHYVVMAENRKRRKVNLVSVTGKQDLRYGVPLRELRDVVGAPPIALQFAQSQGEMSGFALE